MIKDKFFLNMSILKTRHLGFICIIAILTSFPAKEARAGDLKTGAASVVITPPLGVPMAGQYFERGAEAVHDDLYAKAMVFEKDGIRVAVVSCDLVEVTAKLVQEVRKIVEKQTGIPGSHVMMGATHSHTGPVVNMGDIYSAKSISKTHAKYLKELPGLIASSVQYALEEINPAVLSVGTGHEETVSFNRRFYMKNGTVGWNPGAMNPEIIKPAGPIDPSVQVLYAETNDGKPISTYVNFAIHLDIVGGLEISADMPFMMGEILGKFKGEDMITLFGQGCCGNINHVNVKNPGPQGGHQFAANLGTVVAAEVLKTYTRLEEVKVESIRTSQEVIKLPLAKIDTSALPHAREIAAKFGEPNAAPFMEMVEAFKIIDIYERKSNTLDFEIQSFAIGDELAIVALPGEIFTELGMYIKERSPFPMTMVVELANGCIGYVPDIKAFVEGNYEPVSTVLAAGSGELVVEKVLDMLNEMK